MTATVRFHGLQPGTAGPDNDPINYLNLDHSVTKTAVLLRSAANTVAIAQRLSDIKPLNALNTLSLIQDASDQKILSHESTSTLVLATGATAAGGQQLYARIEEVFYVDGTILASNSVSLQGSPIEGTEIVLVNGNQQTRGSTEDYVVVGLMIVFPPTWVLELDDKITVKYLKIA